MMSDVSGAGANPHDASVATLSIFPPFLMDKQARTYMHCPSVPERRLPPSNAKTNSPSTALQSENALQMRKDSRNSYGTRQLHAFKVDKKEHVNDHSTRLVGGMQWPTAEPQVRRQVGLLHVRRAIAHSLVLLAALLVDEALVDVRDHTAAGDGGLDKRVELLVATDGELEVARGDPLHLEVLRGVTGELKHLRKPGRTCCRSARSRQPLQQKK